MLGQGLGRLDEEKRGRTRKRGAEEALTKVPRKKKKREKRIDMSGSSRVFFLRSTGRPWTAAQPSV